MGTNEALFYAISCQMREAIRLLILAGANPYVKSSEGPSIFDFARANCPRMLSELQAALEELRGISPEKVPQPAPVPIGAMPASEKKKAKAEAVKAAKAATKVQPEVIYYIRKEWLYAWIID